MNFIKLVFGLLLMAIILVLTILAFTLIGSVIVFCLDKLGLMQFTWIKGFWMGLLIFTVHAIYPKSKVKCKVK